MLALLLALTAFGVVGAGAAEGATRIVVREGARKLVAIAPTTGATRTLVKLRHGAILGTAATPSGGLLAFASRVFDHGDPEKIWTDRIWTLRAGGRPHLVRTIVSRGVGRATSPVDSLALSRDGSRLLFETRGGEVFVMRADGSGLRPVTPAGYDFGMGEGRNSTRPEFSPDGKRILGVLYPVGASTTDIGGIGTVSARGGAVHFLRRGAFDDGVGHFLSPTFSADGRRIAFIAGAGNSGYAIKVMNRDGSHARALRGSILPGWSIGNPAFSPSGRALTFVGKHHGKGNTIIGKTPSSLFTIRLDGTHRRLVQTEGSHL
ncbi:MAG TPA: hypothetical protein VN671_00895, partial [Solirubrobacterales bacterium]|nr:hypothetical protein [Solirubrobacterales bacterium]